jgi:hypothetical protein
LNKTGADAVKGELENVESRNAPGSWPFLPLTRGETVCLNRECDSGGPGGIRTIGTVLVPEALQDIATYVLPKRVRLRMLHHNLLK